MEINYGYPFSGPALEKLRLFLRDSHLKYDDRVEYSVIITEDDRIAASGSLDGPVLKCVAVSPGFQSEGLAARIVTELVNEAARRERFHLFLFTKPENEELFSSLGFYTITKTGQILFMENKKKGIENFIASFKSPDPPATIGAIVANCNPFTRGHLYLIETAARQCGLLYLFIVSENKSEFPAGLRLELVRSGIAHLSNARLCSTGPYLVSAATFPDYFLKEDPDSVSPQTLNTELDIRIFAECFARPLGIRRRFVGTEPFDPVTEVYNRQMKEILPGYGIELIEIPRLEERGGAVSAGRVRRFLHDGNLEAIKALVPDTTYEYLETSRFLARDMK
jgi:[citrate (pro-3S)-lyase] ligase